MRMGVRRLLGVGGMRVRQWTVWPMLWKEFLQLRRDRLTFAMMTVLPANRTARPAVFTASMAASLGARPCSRACR